MQDTQTISSSSAAERFKALHRLIGNTPLLEINFTFRGRKRALFAKSENLNMTGSIKDRMALHILEKAYKEGSIRPGDRIVEATSGNTGISFASLGRALGHPVTIFMPNWMSSERVGLIRSLGAETVLVTREQGGFLGSIGMAEDFAKKQRDVFQPRQFSNAANIEAHQATTGPEIWWQLDSIGRTPDAFLAGVGTGGTIMGAGRFLKTQKPAVRVHPMEPAESPILSTGAHSGHHRIQGISDELIPPILKLEEVDGVISVSDGDAILMANKLAGELGIAVGISSGANFLGAVMVQDSLDSGATVVTVFPDDNKKYLSTDLFHEEPVRKDYLSPHIELSGFNAQKRVCRMCCELYGCTQRSG